MYLKKIEGTFTAAGGSLFTKFIYKIFTYLDLMLGMGEREKKKGMDPEFRSSSNYIVWILIKEKMKTYASEASMGNFIW